MMLCVTLSILISENDTGSDLLNLIMLLMLCFVMPTLILGSDTTSSYWRNLIPLPFDWLKQNAISNNYTTIKFISS